MSVLRVPTIQSTAGTQSVSQDRLYRGSATAWVNFNGTGTVTIRDNYNVSSITDNGAGDYTVNFTNALSNSNYAVTYSSDISYLVIVSSSNSAYPTTMSTAGIRVRSFSDMSIVSLSTYGGF